MRRPPSRRTLAAENAALRGQIRLLQANEALRLTQLTEQRGVIADLRSRMPSTQPDVLADTVRMPRVRSQVPAPAWPPEGWKPR